MKDTKVLLDEYFKTRPETTVLKIRGQIDRPELYSYEMEIGKPLIDMDAQEIATMLKGFKNRAFSKTTFKFSYRTYDMILSILRDFFNWYIDNYEIIKNPCNDKMIKGKNATLLFADSENVFTTETVNEIIDKIRNSQEEEYADYLEAIVLLFYNGFPEAIDIVNMQESDVNHEKKTVMVRGIERQLSDRLYELLVKINRMEILPAYRGDYLFLSYRGSYFKFPTRERYKHEFNEREPEYWASYISRILNREIKIKLDINVNARTFYLCGFYDYLVDSVGRDEANALITVGKNPENTRKLMSIAKDYGIVEQNVTILKKIMLPFCHS